MSAEYTVPALRDTANGLRSKAAAHFAAKQIEAQKLNEEARQIVEGARRDADAMCASAAEIDAVADSQELRQQAAGPAPVPALYAACVNCGNPIVMDELGWRHPPENTGLCTDPAPPPQDVAGPAADTRVDGQEAGS